MKIKCEVKGIRKYLGYADSDFEIDIEPSQTKENWISLGKAKDVIEYISNQTGIEITPKELFLNPEGVTRIVKLIRPDMRGWRIKPKVLPEKEFIVGCVAEDG